MDKVATESISGTPKLLMILRGIKESIRDQGSTEKAVQQPHEVQLHCSIGLQVAEGADRGATPTWILP
jgi:hypothetical protein